MMPKESFMQILYDIDKASEIFDTVDFEIYFLGGAACVLGEYTDRATRDFDFIDIGYSSKMGRIFSLFRDFDMLEYESTILAPDYKSRAKKLEGLKNFSAYVLAPEDIIVSKIIRLGEKDIEDIEILIEQCDKAIINQIIESVILRDDLFQTKKMGFMNNLENFRERFNV